MDKPLAYGHFHIPDDCGIQAGAVSVTPTANTPTPVTVTFPKPYAKMPMVMVTPYTTVPGSAVRTVSVGGLIQNTAGTQYTGCVIYVYRTNSTATTVMWMATGELA